MNAKNFAKGIGVGMAVGAAMSMSITEMNKKNGKQHKLKLLKICLGKCSKSNHNFLVMLIISRVQSIVCSRLIRIQGSRI